MAHKKRSRDPFDMTKVMTTAIESTTALAITQGVLGAVSNLKK